LAGDALLTYAFQVLSDKSLFRSADAEKLLKISNLIAKKAGVEGMVKGQVMDVKKIGEPEDVARFKTAALIQASLLSGAMLGNASEEELATLSKIGEKIGILFQIVDDILDGDGFAEVFGREGAYEIAKTFASTAIELIRSLNKPQKTALLEEFVYWLLSRVNKTS